MYFLYRVPNPVEQEQLWSWQGKEELQSMVNKYVKCYVNVYDLVDIGSGGARLKIIPDKHDHYCRQKFIPPCSADFPL